VARAAGYAALGVVTTSSMDVIRQCEQTQRPRWTKARGPRDSRPAEVA
jgi:hypothetical protein